MYVLTPLGGAPGESKGSRLLLTQVQESHSSSQVTMEKLSIKWQQTEGITKPKQNKCFFAFSHIHTLQGSGDGRTGDEIKWEKENNAWSLQTTGAKKGWLPLHKPWSVLPDDHITAVTASNAQETSQVDVVSPTLTAHGTRHPYVDSTQCMTPLPWLHKLVRRNTTSSLDHKPHNWCACAHGSLPCGSNLPKYGRKCK